MQRAGYAFALCTLNLGQQEHMHGAPLEVDVGLHVLSNAIQDVRYRQGYIYAGI